MEDLKRQLKEIKRLTRDNIEWTRKLERKGKELALEKKKLDIQIRVINKAEVPDLRDFRIEQVKQDNTYSKLLNLREKDIKDLNSYRKELISIIDKNITKAKEIKRKETELALEHTKAIKTTNEAHSQAKEIREKARRTSETIYKEKAYYIEERERLNKEFKQKHNELVKSIQYYKDKNTVVKRLFRKYLSITKQLKEKDHLLGIARSFIALEKKELEGKHSNLDMRIMNAHELTKKLEEDKDALEERQARIKEVAEDVKKDKHRVEAELGKFIESNKIMAEEKDKLDKEKEIVRKSKLTEGEMSVENKAELDKIAVERNRLRIDIRRLNIRLKELRKLEANK